MQSGKILPVVRQFFTSGLTTRSATDSQSQNKHPYEQPEREPTKEEAEAALKALQVQEEFVKNGLVAELKILEGKFVILVTDSKGTNLRTLKGREILRALDGMAFAKSGAYLGRILDRRI